MCHGLLGKGTRTDFSWCVIVALFSAMNER